MESRGGGGVCNQASPAKACRCGRANRVGSLRATIGAAPGPANRRRGVFAGGRGLGSEFSPSQKTKPICAQNTTTIRNPHRLPGQRVSTAAELIANRRGYPG